MHDLVKLKVKSKILSHFSTNRKQNKSKKHFRYWIFSKFKSNEYPINSRVI